MEFTDFSSFFSGFNINAIVDKIYVYGGIFLLLLVIGLIFGTMYFLWRRRAMQTDQSTLNWWEEIGEGAQRTGTMLVDEIVIPGTLLRIFYHKKKDLWLPRFNRPSAKKMYEILKTKSGQLVNFEVKGLSADPKYAEIAIDHSDMLWAAENTREFVKRNYRDKSKKWWEVYADKIAMAGLMFVFTFCFILIIYFMRGFATDIGKIADQVAANQELCRVASTSGITSALIGIYKGMKENVS